jgi:TolA-binding protein
MNAEQETIAQLHAVIEKLHDRIESLETELSELSDYRAENERDKATIRQQVTEAIEDQDRETGTGSESEGSVDESRPPIAQLAEYGDQSDLAQVGGVTESVERAVTIFQHFSEWSQKAPVGRVVRSNLKTLLNTATGERLAWRQVYRACEKLEEWSKGTIRFEKHRKHGWMLIEERSSSASGG